MFFWIGNPFCWSCYPLRLIISAPVGLGFMVLVLTPSMGLAKYRVLKQVPDLTGAVGSSSDIIWTIGLVFWVMIIAMFIFYKVFRNFVFELCPCLAWCEDDSGRNGKDKKVKGRKEKSGCLCF